MTGDDLRALLGELGVSQANFARLVGVTSRAVSLWMAGERAVPGPVEAYARLLWELPVGQRQAELARLQQRRTSMRDGMYFVQFQSTSGAGFGTLILENGRVYGADPLHGRYDGEYEYNEVTGLADLRLKVTFPPGVRAVFGVSHPYEWSIDVATTLDPRNESGVLMLATPVGPQIQASYQYLRPLPDV
jgi:hypothetical protein